MALNPLVLDLEIRDPFPTNIPREEAWELARGGALGISVACAWSMETDEYLFFNEHNLDELAGYIKGSLLVTYNGKGFDLPCLAGVLGFMPLAGGHYDILEKIWGALGDIRRFEKGWRLGDVCERTIGMSKNGNGSSAPELWATGRVAELYTYCLNDVRITRKLFEHITDEGWVSGHDDERLYLEELNDPGLGYGADEEG